MSWLRCNRRRGEGLFTPWLQAEPFALIPSSEKGLEACRSKFTQNAISQSYHSYIIYFFFTNKITYFFFVKKVIPIFVGNPAT